MAVDGLNLIWHADLVVSGGGTMNREAAALRVPVYSIFRGKIGAVDHQLQKEGRLILVETVEDVDRIPLRHRSRSPDAEAHSAPALAVVVNHIIDVVQWRAGAV
jgi:predicted glycosyltransferase